MLPSFKDLLLWDTCQLRTHRDAVFIHCTHGCPIADTHIQTANLCAGCAVVDLIVLRQDIRRSAEPDNIELSAIRGSPSNIYATWICRIPQCFHPGDLFRRLSISRTEDSQIAYREVRPVWRMNILNSDIPRLRRPSQHLVIVRRVSTLFLMIDYGRPVLPIPRYFELVLIYVLTPAQSCAALIRKVNLYRVDTLSRL